MVNYGETYAVYNIICKYIASNACALHAAQQFTHAPSIRDIAFFARVQIGIYAWIANESIACTASIAMLLRALSIVNNTANAHLQGNIMEHAYVVASKQQSSREQKHVRNLLIKIGFTNIVRAGASRFKDEFCDDCQTCDELRDKSIDVFSASARALTRR